MLKPNIIIGFGGNHKCMFNKIRTPLLFIKSNNCIVGDSDTIIIPKDTKLVWAECELALIVSKKAKKVSYEDAKNYIKGFTIANDVNRINIYNRSEDLAFGKCCDTFLPISDKIVTDIDVSNLIVKSFVNGQQVQSCNTNDLIFDPYKCLNYVSQYFTLQEDDIIITGASVGCKKIPLKDGDIVELEIEKIGRLKNYVKWE